MTAVDTTSFAQQRTGAQLWPTFGRRLLVIARAACLPALIVILWQFVGHRVFTSYELPTPGAVIDGLRTYFFGNPMHGQYSGTFLLDLKASATRVFGGFGLGLAIGVPLGLVLGFEKRIGVFIEPTIQMLRSVPGICWLPLAILWFGFGNRSAIFLVFLGSFYPIVLSTIAGVRYVDRRLVRAARTLGCTRRRAMYSIILPAAMPSIATGIRIGLAYSWIYMILGEFTGVNHGLGSALLLAREAIRPDIIIGLMIVIGLLGVASDWPIQWVLRKTFRIDAARAAAE